MSPEAVEARLEECTAPADRARANADRLAGSRVAPGF